MNRIAWDSLITRCSIDRCPLGGHEGQGWDAGLWFSDPKAQSLEYDWWILIDLGTLNGSSRFFRSRAVEPRTLSGSTTRLDFHSAGIPNS